VNKNTSLPSDSNHPGKAAIICALAAAFAFSIMFSLIKLLGKGYPAGETLFCRSFFAIIPLLPIVMRQGGLEVLKTKRPTMHATRSIIGLISAFTCIESLKLLPLSEAISIFYAAPLITTCISIPLLKEKVTLTKALAVIAGFFGVLLILNPQVDTNFLGLGLALGSAIFSSLVTIELRKMGETEKSTTIVIYFMLACSIAGLATMPFQFVLPTLKDLGILLGVGIIGGIAQICMTEAYHRAPASTIAPLGYTSLVWACLLDMLFFSKIPCLITCLGALLIAASGIIVVSPTKPNANQPDKNSNNSENVDQATQANNIDHSAPTKL
jgi:drug/metabolite transporter (DMT)-like permease